MTMQLSDSPNQESQRKKSQNDPTTTTTSTTGQGQYRGVSRLYRMMTSITIVRVEIAIMLLILFLVGSCKIYYAYTSLDETTQTGRQPQNPQQPTGVSRGSVQETSSTTTSSSTQRWLQPAEEGIFGSDPIEKQYREEVPQEKQTTFEFAFVPTTSISPTNPPTTAEPSDRPQVELFALFAPTTSISPTNPPTTAEPSDRPPVAYAFVPTISIHPTNPPTTANPSDIPSMSAQPTNFPTLSMSPTLPWNEAHVVGNNGYPYDLFPLAKCRGDCDTDNECDWGLICHQREREWEDIPGCEYGEDWDVVLRTQDFCIPNPDLPEDAFRLKMYWQSGYEWQNSTDEMFFCMTTEYEGYRDARCCAGKCWYGDEALPCRSDQVYIELCKNSPGPQSAFYLRDEQQAFRFLPVSDEAFDDDWTLWEISRKAPRRSPWLSSEEVLIQSANPRVGNRRCLQRIQHDVFLEECDYSDPDQRWATNFEYGASSFFDPNDNRMEISQHGFDTQCLASAHHPKSGEVVETHFCEALRADDSQTSHWSRYTSPSWRGS